MTGPSTSPDTEPKFLEEISAGLAWCSEQPTSRRQCRRKQIPWPAEPQYALDEAEADGAKLKPRQTAEAVQES
jgi:hypothetical protein